jgi:hypothetical protein
MLAPNARVDGIERVQMQSDTLDLAMDGAAPRCVEASLVCGAPRFTLQLNLSNHGELPLGFKAMTNAPRRWSVKPNGGVVEPGTTVQIVLSLITARAKESFANDHHLILSLPLQPEDVARLLQLRSAENGRVSIPSLTQDNPQVSQVRLSPQPQPPQPGLEQVIESPLANGACGEELRSASSGCPPEVTNDAMHAAAGELATDLSVAERVKDLQRKFSNAGGEKHRPMPASSRAGLAAEGASASASGTLAASADPSSALSDSTDSEPTGPLLQHPMLRWIAQLLGAVFGEDFFDEFEPWLKWKVYDVLFALGVVLLGRRLSRCPRAQRVLDFVSES